MRKRPAGRVVWFVNQYAGSPTHGMEFRHYELGRELVARGWTVVVITGSYSHLFSRQPEATATYTVRALDTLTYCWVKVPAYGGSSSIGRVVNMVVFMLRLFRLPTKRLPVPDVVVVSSPSLFPFLPAEFHARRLGARLVLEVRDIWPLSIEELTGMRHRHPLLIAMRWVERRAYRHADATVSVLPAAGPHLISLGARADGITTIPNGVNLHQEAPAAGTAPTAVVKAASRHPFNVGFVGTLGLANALDALIEAAGTLADQDIGFVIVGHGPEAPRLQALAADLPNVTFVGAIPKADVAAALRMLDVCYVGYHRSPLYRFGISPNKVFDYMAAARPVILAAEAANDPVGEAACGLTVAPDDPAALADAIVRLRAMPAPDRERLGASGRAFVERVHAYSSLADRYVGVLEPAGR